MNARSYSDQEHAVSLIRPSVASMLLRLVLGLLLLDTAYALLLASALWQLLPQTSYQLLFVALWLLHTLKFTLLLYVIVRLVMKWAGITMMIIGDHLYVDQGVIKETQRVYELAQMQKVYMRQGTLGKLLNFGDVTLILGSRSFAETVRLSAITNPAEHASYFMSFLKPA